jgi:hypothetical protein
MFILPLFLLFSALVCEFEYEAHMKNRAELDWREFLKFKEPLNKGANYMG